MIALFAAAATAKSTAVIDGNYTIEYGIDVPVGLTSLSINTGRTLALANGRSSLLTANSSIGQTAFSVTDGTKFRVGEWVIVSDSNEIVQGGGSQTRKDGISGIVTNIAANVVTIDNAATKAMTVAATATMASYSGLLYFAGRISVTGPGTFDGNRAGQYDAHPYMNSGAEPTGPGSTLTFDIANNFLLSRTNILGGILHGVIVKTVTGGTMSDCTVSSAHDKNILVRGSVGTAFTNLTISDSKFEDGLICYASNANITLTNITATNCNRFGVSLSSSDTGAVVRDVVATSCSKGFADGSVGAVVSNITVTGCGTGQGGLVGGFGFELYGNGTGGSFTGLTVSGVSTFTSAALGFVAGTNYSVNGVTLTKGVGSGATISAIRFLDTATANCSVINANNTDWRWGVRGEVAGVTNCLTSGSDVGSVTDTLNVTGVNVAGMVFT